MTWALVTGAAKRLGWALTLGLAGAGYNVIIHANTSEPDLDAIKNVETRVVRADLNSNDGVEALVQVIKETPDLTLLVNNVGNYLVKPIGETSSREFQEQFQTNLFAPFALSQAAFPSLKKNGGSIVNIGTAGVLTGRVDKEAPVYRLTKQALWGLTRAMCASGVRVNMISPGQLEGSEDLKGNIRGKIVLPSGKPIAYQEVVAALLHLLSPDLKSVTGQNIEVAGGYAI